MVLKVFHYHLAFSIYHWARSPSLKEDIIDVQRLLRFVETLLSHNYIERALQWRNNGRDSISNHQPYDCLLNRLFKGRSKKTSKLRVTGICVGNSPGTKWPVTRKMFPFDDVIMARVSWSRAEYWSVGHNFIVMHFPRYKIQITILLLAWLALSRWDVYMLLSSPIFRHWQMSREKKSRYKNNRYVHLIKIRRTWNFYYTYKYYLTPYYLTNGFLKSEITE